MDEAALEGLADEEYCYLTTVGRVTGRPHTIEIWFALHGTTAYLLAGGGDRSDWVRNVAADPQVRVRIADRTVDADARVVRDADEADRARRMVFEKYQGSYGGDLSGWRDTALPIALELRQVESRR